MTTCRDVVTNGLRVAGVIRLSVSPKAAEADLGMEVLQSLYDSWFEGGEFGLLEDVYKSADVTAEEQQRITAPSGVTVTLPATLGSAGTTRAPYALSGIQTVINGVGTNYIHEPSGWVSLTGLGLNDDAPLASFGAVGLAACHALHWVGVFGGSISPGTKLLADRFISAMRSRRNAANPRTVAEYY